MTDTGGDDRWMTFAELADARGISRASASKLVRRKKWRRQTDNRGTVRILVPLDAMDSPLDRPADNPLDRPSVGPMDISHMIRAFETAATMLREQLARENARADAEKSRADGLSARIDVERDRADSASIQFEQLRRVLREAEAALTAERAAKMTVAAEATQLRQTVDQARVEAIQHDRGPRAEAEQATKAAEAEAVRLRQVAEQAVQEAEALRQAEVARVATQAADTADRPTMVASRIDEVQLRRLQEAEQARKSLGRLARLRLAWRGK
jgi:hypothetical protein